MSKLRITIAGAGSIGRRHLELMEASDACTLHAIVDPAPAASALARDRDVPHHASLDAFFAHSTCDGVIVATPNRLHVANGLTCLRNGVPVLIEKPIADSAEDAERLVQAAEQAGIPLLVGHHRRYSELMVRTRELIASGALGQLVAVQGSALFYKPDDYFDDGPWRREAGGGPVMINLIHEIDNLRALCGEIAFVYAIASNATRKFQVEDTAAVVLKFVNGAVGTFLLSDTAAATSSWEQTSGENSSYARAADQDCYLIAGTRGSIGVPTMRLRTYRGAPSWWHPFDVEVLAVGRADPLARQLAHFCAVIACNEAPHVSGREGLQTLRVTLAIKESASAGHGIALPEPNCRAMPVFRGPLD